MINTGIKRTTEELVAFVKSYANEHYTVGGWDIVAETHDDASLAKLIKGAKTELGALRNVRYYGCLDTLASVRSEHKAMAAW